MRAFRRCLFHWPLGAALQPLLSHLVAVCANGRPECAAPDALDVPGWVRNRFGPHAWAAAQSASGDGVAVAAAIVATADFFAEYFAGDLVDLSDTPAELRIAMLGAAGALAELSVALPWPGRSHEGGGGGGGLGVPIHAHADDAASARLVQGPPLHVVDALLNLLLRLVDALPLLASFSLTGPDADALDAGGSGVAQAFADSFGAVANLAATVLPLALADDTAAMLFEAPLREALGTLSEFDGLRETLHLVLSIALEPEHRRLAPDVAAAVDALSQQPSS